jgi:hypothetical protein
MLPGTIVPGRSRLGDDWPFVPQTPSPASGVADEGEGWQQETATRGSERERAGGLRGRGFGSPPEADKPLSPPKADRGGGMQA